MGAWGPGSFENDAALDWVWELDEDLDASALRRALAAVYDGESDEEAVAAAEVVAAALGRPTAAPTPDEVTEWIERADGFVDDDLRIQALAAVQYVRDRSALRGLWLESGGGEAWLAAIDELAARLAPAP